jgi:hypothetical protein
MEGMRTHLGRMGGMRTSVRWEKYWPICLRHFRGGQSTSKTYTTALTVRTPTTVVQYVGTWYWSVVHINHILQYTVGQYCTPLVYTTAFFVHHTT